MVIVVDGFGVFVELFGMSVELFGASVVVSCGVVSSVRLKKSVSEWGLVCVTASSPDSLLWPPITAPILSIISVVAVDLLLLFVLELL